MNVKKFNEIPEISPLVPISYSMSINPNKKSKISVLNLEKLVKDFSLDITLDNNEVIHNVVPGFISKSLYQVQNDKSKVNFSYTFPPKGPIEPGFSCIYCEKNGPDYHKINCHRPFNSSLILSEENTRFPGAAEGTSYDLIIKKRGQKKIASKRTRSEVFTDNLELFYEYSDETKCVIRISKNGSIMINYAKFDDIDLPERLMFNINKVKDAIIIKPYLINLSYKYMVTGQFNIFPQQYNQRLMINLNIIDNNLWQISLFKKKLNDKTIFIINKNYYFVNKYKYNSGEIVSRNNKQTNPFILFTLIHPSDLSIKYTIMIYVRGSVQIKASYTDKEPHPVELELNAIYNFLKKLISSILIYSIESNFPLIIEDSKTPKKSKINNTVDGKQPQACQKRSGTRPGSGNFRPEPYSFSGVCPMPGYYNTPGGKERPDGKFEPCCRLLKESGEDSYENYAKTLYNGFTVNLPDNLSSVYTPGTKILEKRGFSGLKNMTKKQIVSFMEDNGYINDNDLFKNKESYNSLKIQVIGELQTFVYIQKKKSTLNSLNKLVEHAYMISPINNNTIFVKLFFNKTGNGFFINNFNDVAEAGIDDITLANTIIEGYVYPFEEWMFYAIDIVYHKGENVYQLNFYNNSKNNRYHFLKYITEYLKTKIPIELNYDLNIVNGSKYYLTSEETSSLLFMPLDTGNIFLWSDNLHDSNNTISLNVQFLEKNRWVISIGSRKIPTNLLEQGLKNDIEIPMSFSKRYLKDESAIVLFKINLNRTDHKIEQRKPFTPLNVLEYNINSYEEVITIIESINNPIPRTVFTELTNPPGFVLDHFAYYFDGVGKKLKVETA